VTDDEGARLGVVIADREAARPFSSEDVAAVVALVDRHRAALHDSIEADRLHHQAAHEERDRLARELHDGLAQELVALGYRVDYVRRQASRNGSLLAGSLDDVRAELTHVLGDLRLRISDLHVCPGPGHDLEEILDERLGQFAEASGLVVDLAVSHNGYALPYAVQSLIHRLLLDVLSDARHAPGATRLELQLDLVAPAARLRAAHDGAGTLDARDLAHHPLTALGAVIGVGHPRPQGVELTLYLGSPGAGAGRRHATERTILRS
jgi:signal transduction histidine kinase